MRIAIDLQGLQSEGSRVRGIGRYSFEIIKSIIEFGHENEYILFANGALKNLRNEFRDQLKRKNVLYYEWFAPCPLDFYSNNFLKRKIAIYLRSYSLATIHVDLIFITSYLEGYIDNCLIDIDHDICTAKQVSVFYDLIPLLNPDKYLNPNPKFAKFYRSKISKLNNLDGLLAISKYSANEIIDNLDIDRNKIVTISSACDKNLFNKDSIGKDNFSHSTIINSPFLLYTGAHDSRKNVKGLIHAYSKIDINLRKKYKLVLAGKILEPESKLLDMWINNFNVDKNHVIKTGFISDKELSILYRNCSLFIFPSLHEGFGLPVLEAMSCGAPVIGSNTTSVREVLSNEEAMFDPHDVSSITLLIERALLDQNFKNLLLYNAAIQSKKFSWKKTAKKALKFFHFINSNTPSHPINNSSWATISNHNKLLENKLFTKIFSIKLKKFFLKDSDFEEIASCIDKINIQSSFICRGFHKLDQINSWRIEGPFDSSYSLAILNRCFADKMNNYIDNLSLKITEGPGDYEPNINYLKNYPKILDLYNRSSLNVPYFDVVSRNLYPPRVADMKGKYNILHSYGWEESEFPKNWVESFNSSLQGISVMSSLVKKILIDNGVNIPITISGLGLDHLDQININKTFKLRAKKYKLLHVSSCFPRKGVDILIKAYSRIFTSNDDVSLIIKTFRNPHNNIEELLSICKANNPYFPDVILIYDDLSESQLKSLFLQSDVLVAPSRGEGFGLPIAEAMHLGVPVITTGWGGQMDFCNQSNSWIIDYEFALSSSHLKSLDSYWAEPSLEDLISQIKKVYNASTIELSQKTDLAKAQIQSFTWDKVATENINFILSQPTIYNKNKYFKLGCISPINSKCGIASYSKYLLNDIDEEVIFFTPFNENGEKNYASNSNIIPSWHIGNDIDDLSFLENKILSLGITSLVIQFNFGFYNFSKLSDLIINLKKYGINIFVILHSTVDIPSNESKSLSNLVLSFKQVDRLLVHTINDLNRLKILGLNVNVSLFPHGFLEFAPLPKGIFSSIIRTFKKNIFNIASYGFCLPNKGYRELILACHTLIKKGFNIKLTIYAAIYSDEYSWVYDQLIDLIDELDLSNSISINNKYMKDAQTLKILSKYDCLVFPYQETSESSSASVRHGIACNKNIFVTPSPIFDNVSVLVNYLPGFTPKEIAYGLEKWFMNTSKSLDKCNELVLKRESILLERSFSRLSYRLISMIKSIELN